MVGPDDATPTVSNGPRLGMDVLETRDLTSSFKRPDDTSQNPILAPLVPLPNHGSLQPPGARRPVPIQFVSPYDLSQDTSVCLPAIVHTSTHARADVRCHRLTPGQLPTLPRSKKTTKLKVSSNPSDLPAATNQREGAASATDVLLSIEGQDLKLPPPRSRTGARRHHEKSKQRLNAVRVASELGLSSSRCQGDSIRSLEESLKTLLLCQCMGVTIQITRHRGDSDGLAHPVFHCSRCLKHWADYGRLPPDCKEPEARVSGPSFAITSRSQEILQKFTQLTPVDKRCFLDAIQAPTIPPPRGENTRRLSVSNKCGKMWKPAAGHVKMSVTGMGDEAVRTIRSHSVKDACEFDGTTSTNRDPTPNKPKDTAALPNAESQKLIYETNKKGAKGSSPEHEHDSRCNGEDNDIIDEGNTKGDPDSCPAQEGTEPCVFATTRDTQKHLLESGAEKASSITVTHGDPLNRGVSSVNVDAAIETKLVEGDRELVSNQACDSNCVSPTIDSSWSNETTLGDKVALDGKKQQNEGETLLPAESFLVGDEIGQIEEHLMNISPNVMDEQLRESEGRNSNIETDTQTNVGEADQDMPSKVEAFQDGEQLSDEDTTTHTISKVTVSRNGLLPYLSHETASFNNSAGADDAKSNESFERLINDAEDLDVREQYATPERRQEAKSGQSSLGRQGNGDPGQPPGQESTKGSALLKTWRESSVSYMGVMQDGEEDQNRGTSSSSAEGAATSRGSPGNIARGKKTASRDQMASPIRNTAVRNVTGKPDTRPGNLERHMFATPRETLAKTNALGMVPKPSGEGLANDTTKQGQDRGYLTKDLGSNTYAPHRESNAAATGLPPLNTMPRQLPSTEPKSKARDRKRSLGMPRADRALQDLTDRQQGQEDVPFAGKMDEEQKDISRPRTKDKRQAVPRRREGDASKGQSLPRQLTERPQKIDKLKAPEEQLNAQKKGEKLSTESTDRFLPSVSSTKAEQIEISDGQEKGEKLSPELTDRLLPSVASKKGEQTGISNGQQWREQQTKSPIKSLFGQYDNFELSLSPPPGGSLPPVSTDKSFRMTYSTLPKTFDWDTSRQPPLTSRQTQSPSLMGLPGNLTQQATDELLDATQMKQSTVVQHSSHDFYNKSARTPSRASGKRIGTGIHSSASGSSQESSPAESVWESLSQVWRRHTAELQKLEQMVALNFLPFTSAFTFSLFEIAPQYLAHNRSLREQAMQIRTLRKPKKIVMKFASKEQRHAAMRPPLIRRHVKPVK